MKHLTLNLKRLSKAFALFLLVFYSTHTYSQIYEAGKPPSFLYDQQLKSQANPQIVAINFSVEDLKQIDDWQYRNAITPLKIAQNIPVAFSLLQDGINEELPGGEKITTLRIAAKDAIALIIYYKQFYIPKGGKLFIYNADKTQVLGAYTENTNPPGGIFSTQPVAGDEVVFEYVHNRSNPEQPRIEIAEIGYGYNHLRILKATGPGTSGSCMVDINCSEGKDWQTEKKGVVQTNQKIGSSTYICSASLVNNTAQDYTPYILTAFHCSNGNGVYATDEDLLQWQFNFSYEKGGCGGGTPIMPQMDTMIGCTKIASTPLSGGSDGLLLKLVNNVPERFNPYYLGWDRGNTSPEKGVSIHHPSGDYKKISTFTEKAEHATYKDATQTGQENAFWNVIFAATENGHAVTEGGSSGSPLFNEKHLITATLTGGTSSCSDRKGSNLYGKLHYHWTAMGQYLDPKGNGTATTLASLAPSSPNPAPTDAIVAVHDDNLQISWTKPENIQPDAYTLLINKQPYQASGQSYTYNFKPSEATDKFNIGIQALYGNLPSSFLWTAALRYEPKEALNLKASSESGKAILTWNAPLFEQRIHWGNATLDKSGVGAKDQKTLYFGHLWRVSDIAPMGQSFIKSIIIVGMVDTSQQLLIKQGKQEYTKDIPVATNNKLMEVMLDTPFNVLNNEDLIIAIKVTSNTDKIAYYAQDTSAPVDGQGNLISIDGKSWFALNGANNFIITANLTSTSGDTETKSILDGHASGFVISPTRMDSELVHLDVKESRPMTKNEPAENLESNRPAAFPLITEYKVYRDNALLATVAGNTTTYTDNITSSGQHDYSIVIQYPYKESKPTVIKDVPVIAEHSTPSIAPLLFQESVTILNNQQLTRIDLYHADGRLVESIQNPGNQLNTSVLSAGVYIFRLYQREGKPIVLKGIKQ